MVTEMAMAVADEEEDKDRNHQKHFKNLKSLFETGLTKQVGGKQTQSHS